jgi:hypothetical protein
MVKNQLLLAGVVHNSRSVDLLLSMLARLLMACAMRLDEASMSGAQSVHGRRAAMHGVVANE